MDISRIIILLLCLIMITCGCGRGGKAVTTVKTENNITKVVKEERTIKALKPGSVGKALKFSKATTMGFAKESISFVGYHKITNVALFKAAARINGKEKIVTVAKFPSQYTVNLPENLLLESRGAHFKYCTNALRKELEWNPNLATKFTPKQIEQIKSGQPKIEHLTWHHSEKVGKMELVDEEIHQKTKHDGGFSIWGQDSIKQVVE